MVNKPHTHPSLLQESFSLSPLAACIRIAIAGSVLMTPMQGAQAEDATSAHLSTVLDSATGLSNGLPNLPTANDAETAAVTSQSGNVETINLLHTDKAILNWKDFNVAPGHEVDFIQKDASSVALNRIFQGSPSEILGEIKANGQIYLYNQNGFLFGQDSVVDTHGLVASNLYISDDAFNGGITQQSSDKLNKPAFGNDNSDPATAVKLDKSILIQKGAKIHAHGNDGMIILAAPTIENKGSITTADPNRIDDFGQVILVASQDKVYLQPADPKSPFHGLVVEVDTGGKVSNIGDIVAKQGNITLQGFAVNQEGRLTATTSVNENGSIRLLAQESHHNQSGLLSAEKTVRSADKGDGLSTQSKVTFGSNSVTEVYPEYSTDTAIDTQTQRLSLLQVVADRVEFKGQDGALPGAQVVAPGAQVDIIATADPTNINPITGQLDSHILDTSANAGRVLIESGAVIDVSGQKNIAVAMERNSSAISVQSYDLRDAPLQKSGPLLGTTVYVDLRQPNNILDPSGAMARIARTVEERLGNGGVVNIASDGDAIVNSGAEVNISGGSLDYQSGFVRTSQLIDQYGKLVDISQADPNQIYASVFGVIVEHHDKWIADPSQYIRYYTADYLSGRYEQGYTQGLNAGALNITAQRFLWSGDLQAGAVSGVYQRDATTAPTGGTLTFNSDVDINAFYSSQNIAFESVQKALQVGINDTFPVNNSQPADLVLSDKLVNHSGLQTIRVQTQGDVVINKDLTLATGQDTGLRGALSVQAKNIDVNGNVEMSGGSVNLSAIALSYNDGNGKITLSKDSSIDVSGRWVNDFKDGASQQATTPKNINGGSVNIHAQGDLFLKQGSVIKADGGAYNSISNTIKAGNGGSIALSSTADYSSTAKLHLDGQLSAFGLFKSGNSPYQGGTLSLTSPSIWVSGKTIPVSDQTLLLTTEQGNLKLAENGGFSKIYLNSTSSSVLDVKGDVKLNLIQQYRILQASYPYQNSSNSIAGFSYFLAPKSKYFKQNDKVNELWGPVDLTLKGAGGVKMETDSRIIAYNKAIIELDSTSRGGVYVDGTIKTIGGAININLVGDANNTDYEGNKAIWLDSHARLLARGGIIYDQPGAIAAQTGQVLNGGQVALHADRGYIVQEKGSIINVSGDSAILGIPHTNQAGNVIMEYKLKTIASDAGMIDLKASSGMVLNGTWSALAGSENNKNGQLNLAFSQQDLNFDSTKAYPTTNVDFKSALTITQDNPISLKPDDNLDKIAFGKATVTSAQIEQAGFDDVRMTSDKVNFTGNVDLSTRNRLDFNTYAMNWHPDSTSIANTGTVNLNTSYLNVATPLIKGANPTPVHKIGGGVFTSHADWTELNGKSVWNGFNTISLNNKHELRLLAPLLTNHDDVLGEVYAGYNGSMTTAASLNLNASQIYPTTLTQFSFNVVANPNGHINISGSRADASPLSANGSLTFNAPIINQSGVLKAPLGAIQLLASQSLTLGNKSITSVSGAGQLIPFGATIGGIAWVYPYSNNSLVYYNKPDNNPVQTKQLSFVSPKINLAKGSVVDIAGGGDLLAYEFRSGIGGTNDYLATGSPSYLGGFAVVPSMASALMPSDPAQSDTTALFAGNQQSLYQPGNSVYLSGGNGLPAGHYTIMPATYALLPGAFLVTPQPNHQDFIVNSQRPDGAAVVSGYYTNLATGTRDARTSAFMIENGTQIRAHSSYIEQTANNFFTQQALAQSASNLPLLPKDSGQLYLEAQDQLLLQGTINAQADVGGRGAKVDIVADNINIVNNLNAPATGTLQVLAGDLNKLGLDSLFLGGKSTFNNVTGETSLNVKSSTVTFEKGVNLKAKDLLVAAKSQIEVKSGASITTTAAVSTGDTVLNVTGNGALLRVSADNQVKLNRTPGDGSQGDLLIDSGSTIQGAANGSGSVLKSVLLDASHTVNIDGNLIMQGGALSLNAKSIALGEVKDVANDGLKISNQQLTNLNNLDELLINSTGSINFYGNVGKLSENGSIASLQIGKLALDATGISGFNNAGKNATIKADTISVQNSSLANNSASGNGSGQLTLLTNNYVQGAGDFAINGFNEVSIKGTHDNGSGLTFTAEGKANLAINSNVNVTAGTLMAKGGSNLTVNTAGHQLNFVGTGTAVAPSGYEFGGQVNLIADSLYFNTQALMPSGKLALSALTGDLTVGSAANINLAGRSVNFADFVQYTPGGTFSAMASAGKLSLQAGSLVNINPAGTAKGGQLILKAPQQSIDLSGDINAQGASVQIDQAKFSGNSHFDSLMAQLASDGINGTINVRIRQDDIVQASGQQIQAQNINLVADNGFINLNGTLNTSASQAGNIQLYSAKGITLADGAQLLAVGSTGHGGNVLLSSLADNSQAITIQQGSHINVAGASANAGGDVTLRALRNGTGVDMNPIQGTVEGFKHFYADAVQQYTNADITSGNLDAAFIKQVKTDTLNYMDNAQVDLCGGTTCGAVLRPGIEINYDGSLALTSTWDLMDWKYNGVAGELTIKATDSLSLQRSLTDGFAISPLPQFNQKVTIQPGESWSYQLVAGADTQSAYSLATLKATADELASGQKNLTLGFGVARETYVRTGTGNIDLAAGGDIVFKNQNATVYIAGRPDNTNPYGTTVNSGIASADFPVDGGNLTVYSDNSIVGTKTDQIINNPNGALWMYMYGNNNNSTQGTVIPTRWGINFSEGSSSNFRENFGSFGGGQVAINAAGSINDLSVIMPSTGKQIGQPLLDAQGNQAYNKFNQPLFINNKVDINGGGNLAVVAGGDIKGGVYYLGQGSGTITSGGQITGGKQLHNGPQLLMSDSNITLNATSGLSLSAVSDPMMAFPATNQQFFSYTANSAVNAYSLAGDIHLGSDITALALANNFDSQSVLAKVYPASLQAVAFGGNALFGAINLFPSTQSTLNILARDSIDSMTNTQASIAMLDIDQNLLPSMYAVGISDKTAGLFNIPDGKNVINAPVLHGEDSEMAHVVTQQGDINGISLYIAKPTVVQSGRDIKNINLTVQNNNTTDVSVVSAGRDITAPSSLTTIGTLDSKNSTDKIAVNGPGNLLVKAGRNIDLGVSGGILSTGNTVQPNLPDGGANLAVLAGINKTPDYAGFIKYLTVPANSNRFAYFTDFLKKNISDEKKDIVLEINSRTYNATTTIHSISDQEINKIDAFLNNYKVSILKYIGQVVREYKNDNSLTDQQALDQLVNMSDSDLASQPKLINDLNDLLISELHLAGEIRSIVKDKFDKELAYKPGFDALSTLFPGSDWKGDIDLKFSTIQTQSGGDINLHVPGGLLNVGLPFAFPNLIKTPSELGIIAQGAGNITAVTKGDIDVNQSRIFTQNDGAITLWTSRGNLNAGNGANSALSVPVLEISYKNDIKHTVIKSGVSGSGIRALDKNGQLSGNIALFTPNGVVNAGEAGIAGKNLLIATKAIINGTNIQFTGTNTGGPSASTSAAAGLTGVSNVGANVTQVAQSSVDTNDDAKSSAKKAALGVLSVEVLAGHTCKPGQDCKK